MIPRHNYHNLFPWWKLLISGALQLYVYINCCLIPILNVINSYITKLIRTMKLILLPEKESDATSFEWAQLRSPVLTIILPEKKTFKVIRMNGIAVVSLMLWSCFVLHDLQLSLSAPHHHAFSLVSTQYNSFISLGHNWWCDLKACNVALSWSTHVQKKSKFACLNCACIAWIQSIL